MDHLPPPIDHDVPDRVHFYAPLAKREVYSAQDFFTIPAEYGYTDFQDLLENGLDPSMSRADANEFLQSWLWFALLAQVLDTEVFRAHFHRNDDTLTTKNLNTYLFKWIEREKEAAENGDGLHHAQTSSHVRANNALDSARRFVSKHCAHDRMDRDDRSRLQHGFVCPYEGCSVDTRVDEKLALSLAILGEALQIERPQISASLEGRVQFCNQPEIQEKNWGHSSYCRHKFQENGWCPFAIRRMEATLNGVTNVYLICRTMPPKPKADHSGCTTWGCTAVKPAQTALHMGGCDGVNCQTDKLDELQMVEWISQGKTPLVALTDAIGMKYFGHDLKKDKDVLFVALTHCWEDAIVESGKDHRNGNNRSMHRCQLARIHETCSRLFKNKKSPMGSKDVYLWIDVLCLPREGSVRASAINQMKTIYSKAKTVLVWDRQLLQLHRGSSLIETNMRVRMSNWAQRLWTLQEAVLASDLHIQFKDGTVSLKELEKERDRARSDLYHDYHHVWKAGHPFSSAVWRLRQPQEDHQVQRAWEAMQFRLLKEPKDEAIIIANMLKLNVKELEDLENLLERSGDIAAKRMAKLLEMLDQEPNLGIPSGIIFLPPPKLALKGYGWAPRTWLSKQAHAYPLMRPQRLAGSMMKQGFLVEFPGLVLHCSAVPPENEKFWIPVQQGLHKWYKVVADKEGKGENFKGFWENQVCQKSEPCIILSTRNPRERWEIGILVQTKGLLTRGEVRWVKTLCRVWVRLETNTNIIKDLGNQWRDRGDAMMFGERLDSQKWCVDGDDCS
ncbi:hypothetical protein BDR22DRAFT_820377 [Usnea florida]